MGQKGDRTRETIIQAATYCLAHLGERATTFQAIADRCRLSQPLVVRYLKSREQIIPTVIEYWVEQARRKTEEALARTGGPEERLRDYLRVSIDVFNLSPEISKLYLMLHYYAGINDRMRALNTEIKETAVRRIAGIIQEGISRKVFRKCEADGTARLIHASLVGYLLSLVTESPNPAHLKIPARLEEFCLAYLKFKA